ncbi:MAG: hypothetical protein E7620_06430 [Ruminococcaceae bacterium]|nr:hypothetical protein [Oscillospiraceae bacterium]
MDWKEFQESTRALTDYAAQKINQVSDMASMHLKLKAMELRLRELYQELGMASYEHFTKDDSGAEVISKYVEAIALLRRQIAMQKKAIKKAQELQNQ